MNGTSVGENKRPYLSLIGAWALAFGCSVGWGAFVMPGNTFLPIAGPVGTAVGMAFGAMVMLIIGKNYHYLINRFPDDGGGAYTYTKICFGYDQGFLASWFLILTYIAIIWANATALPLIARTLLGSTFQFGFHYEIAGYHVYFGEIVIVIAALALGALVCLRRKAAEGTQTVMAILLFVGIVVCFVAAALKNGGETMFEPAFSENYSGFGGTFTIFALAPWAFVGFESISHSAHEAKFKLKRSFAVMAAALAAAAIAYICLALMSVVSLPEGCSSWRDYISGLDKYSGVQSQPAFFSAYSALGNAGSVILGVAAMGAMFTGIIGNYIALSRLLSSMSNDGLSFGSIGKLDKRGVPRSAILTILGVSVILPFFGRTAISWIVDVTTVGATIAFAFVSGSAFVDARKNKKRSAAFFGAVGLAVSLLFAVEFLVPNITAVKTLSTESYLILAGWGILGFIVFNAFIRKDKKRLFGRSSIAWIVLLGLIIFTSTVWMRQTTSAKIDSAIMDIGADHVDELDIVENSFLNATIIQVLLIITALAILFIIYSKIQKRERQTEIEKAMAEENSRAKTSFLSNMSHEIRTPMNAIIGLDNITLRDPDLSPQTRENLEKIGSSARHLLGLINDILDMSRIESGRMVLKQEEFSFKEIIGQVNIIINGQCLDKGLTYEFVTRGLMKDYYIGDDMKLKQVLINILGNSVKFTDPPGVVSLTAEHIDLEDGACRLRFVMKDTGIGMDKEFIPKLFEAFSQEDATTTNRYGGSGLGMAITKNFVEIMGGDISVESEKGVGSTFTVTVTLKSSDRVDTPAEDLSQSGSGTEENGDGRSLAGRRVLIAEDIDTNAEILADILDLEDIVSERAENGEKAVSMFKSKPAGYYDAILMDVRMPVMDGLTAAQTIRALDKEDAKTVPIIAMTANVFEEDVALTAKAGINAHLAKPIEPDKIYAKLAELIYG